MATSRSKTRKGSNTRKEEGQGGPYVDLKLDGCFCRKEWFGAHREEDTYLILGFK